MAMIVLSIKQQDGTFYDKRVREDLIRGYAAAPSNSAQTEVEIEAPAQQFGSAFASTVIVNETVASLDNRRAAMTSNTATMKTDGTSLNHTTTNPSTNAS